MDGKKRKSYSDLNNHEQANRHPGVLTSHLAYGKCKAWTHVRTVTFVHRKQQGHQELNGYAPQKRGLTRVATSYTSYWSPAPPSSSIHSTTMASLNFNGKVGTLGRFHRYQRALLCTVIGFKRSCGLFLPGCQVGKSRRTNSCGSGIHLGWLVLRFPSSDLLFRGSRKVR